MVKSSKRLYVHIGPFKTGTTAIQEYFWHHRRTYRAAGLLYPNTGIVGGEWGRRHTKLARSFDAQLWGKLVSEIEGSDCDRVLLSSERFCQRLDTLAAAKEMLEPYCPQLIIFIRDEKDMVQSMYFQVVKGSCRSMKASLPLNIAKFPDWWLANRHRYVYQRMIERWAKSFGSQNITFVKYRRDSKGDAISDLCDAIGVAKLKRPPNQNTNESIGGFAARWAHGVQGRGHWTASRALAIAYFLEQNISLLRGWSPAGFEPVAVEEYYRESNRSAELEYPSFGEVYRSLRQD